MFYTLRDIKLKLNFLFLTWIYKNKYNTAFIEKYKNALIVIYFKLSTYRYYSKIKIFMLKVGFYMVKC